MKKLSIILICLACMVLNSGCGTIYDAAVDERNVKTIASDTKIKSIILQKLMADEAIKSLDMTASCYNGRAYLVGEYEIIDQKNRAMAHANSVEGVRDLVTYLIPKKKKDTCTTTDNIATRLKIEKALIEDKEIWSTNIDVKVIQCETVVLWGLVGTQKEIDRAVAWAKAVQGVKTVKTLIRTNRQL